VVRAMSIMYVSCDSVQTGEPQPRQNITPSATRPTGGADEKTSQGRSTRPSAVGEQERLARNL
jgi:hypothetical protein